MKKILLVLSFLTLTSSLSSQQISFELHGVQWFSCPLQLTPNESNNQNKLKYNEFRSEISIWTIDIENKKMVVNGDELNILEYHKDETEQWSYFKYNAYNGRPFKVAIGKETGTNQDIVLILTPENQETQLGAFGYPVNLKSTN